MKKLIYVFLVILVGGLISAAAPKKPNKRVILDGEKKIMIVKKSYVEADSAAVASLLPTDYTMEVKPR